MTRIFPLGLATGLCMTGAAFAVGGLDDVTPPTPTETTTTCPDGSVWDDGLGRCMAIQDSRLAPDKLIAAARELAYADRHQDAIDLLSMAADPADSMVQTYLGFAHRRAGRIDLGLDHYDRALAANPDNILARAYLGMAYVQLGDIAQAEVQLAEIRARGGADLWPDTALAAAIAAGDTTGYDY